MGNPDIDGSCQCADCGTEVDDDDFCFTCEMCLTCCTCDPESSQVKCRKCKSDIFASQICPVDGCGGCSTCCGHHLAEDAECDVCALCENPVQTSDMCRVCGHCDSCCTCSRD